MIARAYSYQRGHTPGRAVGDMAAAAYVEERWLATVPKIPLNPVEIRPRRMHRTGHIGLARAGGAQDGNQ
jgi:hypothetical protein